MTTSLLFTPSLYTSNTMGMNHLKIKLDWIHVTWFKDQLQALVNLVVHPSLLSNANKFSTEELVCQVSALPD